jgi:2-polyprenyl-6-methoxyphenol hydroxylase-like FAD-dependent oxidoreductase
MRFDVVIVGAGIGGAVLALDLGRRGWRVALVERETAPPRLARPEVLWGATARALEPLGMADAIRDAASVRLEAIEIGGQTPWLRMTRDDFAAAGVEAFSTNPAATRAAIADAAVATGNVETHRGVTVTELVRDGGRVAGVRGTRGGETATFEATLVVGDDGGQSAVRTRLGIPLDFDTFPIEFVTAALTRWPLPPQRVRVWIDLRASAGKLPAAGCFPWPKAEGVLLLPLTSERAQYFFEAPAETFWRALEGLMPVAQAVRDQVEFPRDFKRVTRPFGHAGSYVDHGAALIGDAAHPMTPAGGQGANASIWDALALADVADAALRAGDVSKARLQGYERLRRPINDRSVSISRRARLAFGVGRYLPLAAMVPLGARTVEALGWPKRAILRSFGTTFVHPRPAPDPPTREQTG